MSEKEIYEEIETLRDYVTDNVTWERVRLQIEKIKGLLEKEDFDCKNSLQKLLEVIEFYRSVIVNKEKESQKNTKHGLEYINK